MQLLHQQLFVSHLLLIDLLFDFFLLADFVVLFEQLRQHDMLLLLGFLTDWAHFLLVSRGYLGGFNRLYLL